MLLILLEWLELATTWKIPSVFHYFSTRMVLAALTALIVTLILGPKCIAFLYHLKTGQSIRVEDCPTLAKLHENKKHTPTMGGILILFAIIIALLCWMDLKSSFTLLLLCATLWLGLIGGLDDYLKMRKKNSKGLPGRWKFLMQCILGGAIACYLLIPSCAHLLHHGDWFIPPMAKQHLAASNVSIAFSAPEYQGLYFLPFKKAPLFIVSGIGLILSAFIIIFVITGTSNAVNLADGLDGLASGLVLIVAAVLAVFAFLSNHIACANYLHILYIEGSGEIAVFLSALFGACLGFLWYNSAPAQVFMGDVGSIALGGLLGLCAILLRRELILALVGGVLVMEAASVIIQVLSFKLRKGKRVFLCSPIHHHFEYLGWPETKIVIRFWIIGLLLALIAFASLKVQ